MYTSSTLAAALLALAPAVQAVGNAVIYNKCSFDVYVWAVGGGQSDGPNVLKSGSGKFSQEYKSFSSGGMSMKISKTKSPDKITQFEYTLGTNNIWYDLSNVNCVGKECPFQPEGIYMESGSGCPVVTCTPGNATCGGAYTLYNDDWASKACSPSEDTSVYLCSESASGSSSDSGSDSSSSSDDSAGYIGALTSLIPHSTPSASPKPAQTSSKKAGDEQVAAAAVSTPESKAPSKPTPSSTSTSTSTTPTSTSAASSSAAPETTPPPAPQYVETTLVTYVTQWQTKFVDSHEGYHHNPKRVAQHPHARRHQHH